jgi:hypothetical protein
LNKDSSADYPELPGIAKDLEWFDERKDDLFFGLLGGPSKAMCSL